MKLLLLTLFFFIFACKKPGSMDYADYTDIHFINQDGTEFFNPNNKLYQKDSVRLYHANSMIPISDGFAYYGYHYFDSGGKIYFRIFSHREKKIDTSLLYVYFNKDDTDTLKYHISYRPTFIFCDTMWYNGVKYNLVGSTSVDIIK